MKSPTRSVLPLARTSSPRSGIFLLGLLATLGIDFAESSAQEPITEPVARMAPEWEPLTPIEFEADSGVGYEILPDGSLLIEGADKDRHVIEFLAEMDRIAAIRVEALPHDSLPAKGPGGHRGNFILSEIEVHQAPQHNNRFREVPVKWAASTHEQPGWPAASAIDLSPATGWGIGPHMGKSHSLVYRFTELVGNRKATRLKVSLNYQHGGGHVLRRVRIWATRQNTPFLSPAAVLGDEFSQELRPKIGDAIAKGVRWLLPRQSLDGSWSYHQSPYLTGQTALSVYTLLKCGVREDAPAVRRGLEFIKAHPPKKTYSAACQVMALTALKELPDDADLQGIVDLLLEWNQKGGFSYPSGAVDLSNTQYACLALHLAATKGGIKIPRTVWKEIEDRTLTHATGEGRYTSGTFQYRPNGGNHKASASMTAAGVVVASICETHLPRLSRDMINAKEKGLEWLGKNFSASSNIQVGAKPANNWLFYYLYGLERVGGLTELSHFGPHDWYREGAKYLVEAQKKEGEWGHEANTCFALLFLAKATAPTTGETISLSRSYLTEDEDADIRLRAAGEAPLSIWIESFGDNALDDLAWIGERDRGLRVAEVRYVGCKDESFEDTFVLDELGGADQPHGHERFATQVMFERPGKYWVRAEVMIGLQASRPASKTEEDAQEDEEGAADQSLPDFEKLVSDPLEIIIDQATDVELLEYAGDAKRNLLPRSKYSLAASSELNGQWAAVHATDNLLGKAWLSADDDPLPSLTLDFESPIVLREIVLTHASPDKRPKRIQELEVRLNGRKSTTYKVTMVADDWRKTQFELPKKVKVRRIEIQVLKCVNEGDQGGVGLAEVELR